MASDEDEEVSSRAVEPGTSPARLHDSMSPRREVNGHTFWRTDANGRPVELTTATGIELDEQRTRWTVSVPGAKTTGEGIESGSRDVRRFMNGVLGAMQRATHRATVRPAPKPRPTPAPLLPPTAPVPCPLCHGEAWPDCEVCDGAGIITARQAEAWRNGTWGRDEDHD
jgi:hypothetical protein